MGGVKLFCYFYIVIWENNLIIGLVNVCRCVGVNDIYFFIEYNRRCDYYYEVRFGFICLVIRFLLEGCGVR